MKYITTEDNAMVIFSRGFNHDEIARKLNVGVCGAGFIRADLKKCYGESISLGIKMHENDNRTLDYHLNEY